MQNRKLARVTLMLLLVGGSAYAQKKDKAIHFGNENGTVYDIALVGHSRLAVAEENEIKIYNVNDQKLLKELKGGHTAVILSIDISIDSSKLVSAGRDGNICLWEISSGNLITKLDYHQGTITSVKFSPDNKLILSGGTDNNLILYNIASENEVARFPGHSDDILSVAFHPNGNLIASSGADKTILLWDVQLAKRVAKINNLKGWQRQISFSPDSAKLISCGDNSTIKIWEISDTNGIQLTNQIKQGSNWLLSHDLNEDGKTIVAGGMDGKIHINYSLGKYTYKGNKPITKVLFKSNESPYLKVIASTMGGGVTMVDSRNMKSKKQ